MTEKTYKINMATKIGREINKIINKYPKLKDFFKKNKKSISFLTTPGEERSEYNIEIYPGDRIERIKNNTDKKTTIYGCIPTAIKQHYDFFEEELKKEKVVIIVKFGKKAASSRCKYIYENPKVYEPNSHKQIDEIKYLFNINNLNFIHKLDMSEENTKITIGDKTLEIDTVNSTAIEAIKEAVKLISKKDINELI